MKKLIVGALLAALALALTGCDPATMNAPGNTTLATTAGGAGLGALIGGAHGRGGKGALTGAAIGGLGGYAVGATMENNRNRAIQQQQQVQGAYDAGYRDAQAPPPPPPPPPRSY